MASVGAVVEISSDEEDFPASRKLPVDPFGWVSDFFDADGRDDAIRDDLDELMVMSEWSSPPVLQKAAKPDDLVIRNELPSPAVHQKKVKSGGGAHDEEWDGLLEDVTDDDSEGVTDDDDCVVLDGDPDKAVTVGEEEGSMGDSSSDELQIVAEKGPIACRDFPHSRHLCSNFPFKTTSHEKYCNMCHCFVCDTPAPCKYWGNGASVTEHCHATDKEGQWKELRQAFKFKRMPASGPEKHQSVACSTTMSPGQQSMLFEVAVPQSLPSNMDHHSVANQSPALYDVSQIQQRNSSVRVSLCLTGTVSTPRAGRGTSNSHIPQNTHSHAMFKRLGSFPPVRTARNAEPNRLGSFPPVRTARNTEPNRLGAFPPARTARNANQFGSAASPDNSMMNRALPNVSRPTQVARRTNAFTGTAQDSAPLRSLSAPLAFHAQQGQPTAYDQVTLNGKNVTEPQLSRCTSLTGQRTQCLDEPVIDVSTKSWEDILACVASDLGVADYNLSNSGLEHSTVNQGFDLQHGSVTAIDNLASSHAHDLLNPTTGSNVRTDAPLQTTETMHHMNCESSLLTNESHINSFASSPADDLAIETARQLEISGVESNFLFEFDWD